MKRMILSLVLGVTAVSGVVLDDRVRRPWDDEDCGFRRPDCTIYVPRPYPPAPTDCRRRCGF